MSIARTLIAAAALAAVSVIPASAQDFNAAPNYGTVNLRTGFTPDPFMVQVQSGGTLNAERISASCLGFISNAPDVRLNFVGGSNLPLVISAASNADTTLVINGPDGRWYCDDDGGANGLNPGIRFNNPMSGRYEIWVGTFGSTNNHPARLEISELTTQ
jgi:hypothetical protein